VGMFKLLPEATAVETKKEALAAIEEITSNTPEWLAVDTETTGLFRPQDYTIILAISDGTNRYAIYGEAIIHFTELLQDPSINLIFANAAYDLWMLANIGIDVHAHTKRRQYRCFDIQVMHHLYRDIDPHGLKWMAKRFLDIDMVEFSEVFDLKSAKNKNRELHEVLLDPAYRSAATNYASLDAYVTYQLFWVFKKLLEAMKIDIYHCRQWLYAMDQNVVPKDKDVTMWDYYVLTELPFTKVLHFCERNGLPLDDEALITKYFEHESSMQEVERWFCKHARTMSLNLNSDDDMRHFFYERMGYKHEKTTDSGEPSLDDEVLKDWNKKYDCIYVKQFRKFKASAKILSTYVIGLKQYEHVGPLGKRIHPSLKQTGTKTGRLSSSDPNLQNQPASIRVVFKAREGWALAAPDFSQLEMRILAHLSNDENLCNIIWSNQDIHCATAALMFGLQYDDIIAAKNLQDEIDELNFNGIEHQLALSAEQKDYLKKRKASKAINFGLMYGAGPKKLAEQIGVDIAEAKHLIRLYFAQFPGIEDYFESLLERASALKYFESLLGRRRVMSNYDSYLSGDVARAQRQTKNVPQACAAELVKMAMIRLWEDPWIEESGSLMLLQVHDEVVFELCLPYTKDPAFAKNIEECMVEPLFVPLDVPLEAKVKYGNTWLECK